VYAAGVSALAVAAAVGMSALRSYKRGAPVQTP